MTAVVTSSAPHAARTRAGMLILRGLRRILVWVVGFAVAILGWAVLIKLTQAPPYLAAGPPAAYRALLKDWSVIVDALRVTMVETGVGLTVSTALALGLSTLFVAAPTAERALMPMALVFRSVPVVAIGPLIVLMVGRGLSTSIVCVTIVTFFPVLVMATRGFRSLSPEMEELFRVHGASMGQVFRYARIPNAVPFIFTGLRMAVAKGVLGAMLAEWLTGSEGLGHLLVFAESRREMGLLWATLVVATGSAVVVFQLTVAAERAVQRRTSTGRA
jgi:NitT/TauT family transport system permease protein